jgi:hypothetical protein
MPRCQAKTQDGTRCKNHALDCHKNCAVHKGKHASPARGKKASPKRSSPKKHSPKKHSPKKHPRIPQYTMPPVPMKSASASPFLALPAPASARPKVPQFTPPPVPKMGFW